MVSLPPTTIPPDLPPFVISPPGCVLSQVLLVLGGLSGPEAGRTILGASGCRGGLQRVLRSQPMSPCRVPSCRSPVHVFTYSCAPPPRAVPAPIHLRSLAAIVGEELAHKVQKQLSIKERAIHNSPLALVLSEFILVLHWGQIIS